ncbi:hypothetical protein [Streptococcus acidominimus]|uniref:Uncharacterized protein n=1 Tax=Streptococcus acidominimus TaxID=1326 RepID=A0A4Y9FT02_STRAI|nr:hypothetical protein [Streptococcus acidominimus]MBF0818153.1 hypothetical protein [Streptococcus acidominimus]MBF0840036.1 hypothetical protein [Streptococcus acidominimus]MBF0847353.1 hypothetical protein [Streptococcus danieliae]TFU31670.1 hypothetical protein E4U01_01625 [Streptococcus acidominimus]
MTVGQVSKTKRLEAGILTIIMNFLLVERTIFEAHVYQLFKKYFQYCSVISLKKQVNKEVF